MRGICLLEVIECKVCRSGGIRAVRSSFIKKQLDGIISLQTLIILISVGINKFKEKVEKALP